MTTAFAALLIGVVGAALLLALVAFLWVNRTPSTNERFDDFGRVPLFGVDLTAAASAAPAGAGTYRTPPASSSAISNLSDDPDVAETEEAESIVSSRDFSAPALHPEVQTPTSRPFGKPVAIDNSAIEVAEANASAAPANPATNGAGRLGGMGWRANGGWPSADQAATPRFSPPVRDASADMRTPPRPHVENGASPNGNGTNAEDVPGSMVEGHRIRFSTPMEGTLQFLPGRLEISSGLDTGREIRFVRVPGPNGTEVTFGRNEGPLYRHIQLRDQTVSREHARMTLAEGRWLLTNLSRTNPVAHNGRVLSPGEHQPLEDGDRLEMGEVVFSFRSR